MNETPIANRLHIGIFGRRNAGKSSLINALTGQKTAIVDSTPGTTTDPVGKAMEIPGMGPVFIYDTAGIDDSGELGNKRVERTKEVIHKINIAIVVSTYTLFDNLEETLIEELKKKTDAVIVVFNKSDVEPRLEEKEKDLQTKGIKFISSSCTLMHQIDEIKKIIIEESKKITVENRTIAGDIIKPGTFVVLVVPIDLGAPKGRLILPQVQVIRDILDNDAYPLVVKERELSACLAGLKEKPSLVICDSQVVLKAAADTDPSIPLTTFSILFSRLKGDLKYFVESVKAIDELKDGDKVLILEACTHHSTADDIGRVKIPRWIRQYTGKKIEFETNSGPYVSKDLTEYRLVISCGACMINRKEMLSRLESGKELNVPVTNYGIAISYVQGVLPRVVKVFGL